MSALQCRVCGWNQSEPPWDPATGAPTFNICSCCGCEFGYEDGTEAAVIAHRQRWIASGGRWFDPEAMPRMQIPRAHEDR